MNGKANIINILHFAADLQPALMMMTRKDVFSNMQLYTERTLGIDYFTSCQVSEVVAKTLMKTKGKDIKKEDMMLKVSKDLNKWAQAQQEKKNESKA